MLEISHLRYDVTAEDGNDLGILRDVSLTVGDGKLVVITGPNGGGKTSLAKTIMGPPAPSAGTAPISPTSPSPTGQKPESVTAFSSRPALRG